MLDLFDIPVDGYHRVPAFVKRHTKAKGAPWLPTLIQIPRDDCEYKPCEIEVPAEWEVTDNGFGCLVFHRRGDPPSRIWTAYGVVDAKIGTIIRNEPEESRHWGGK